MNTLGAQIKARRKALRVTQQQVSLLSGIGMSAADK
jgi:transcriptional regulator with XRE-family HTH domain